MKFSILIIFFAASMIGMSHHLERVWTDERGRSTKAVLLKVENSCAILKLPDGREATFPLAQLSKIDQAFIEKFGLDGHDEEEPEEDSEEGINFDAEWPEKIKFEEDPEVLVTEEDEDKKLFIYESANYRYNCDVKLSPYLVKQFAVMFEATHQFARELPLAINGGKKTDDKYQIYLFETEQSYFRAGGPPGSAGVYIGGKNIILVPLTSLGVRQTGSRYTLDREKSSKTLPHELTHQLTPNSYYSLGARGWFTEGLAEYIANTPYFRFGMFNLNNNSKAIIEYVTAYGKRNQGGRALGEEINLGPLKDFMLQSYSSFTSNAQINYGCGLLISYYFFEMDRDKDAARIKKFLKALREGKQGEAALEVLLDGQTWLELEAEIANAYKKKGIDFTFSR